MEYEFSINEANANTVALAGDFNSWVNNKHFLERKDGNRWSLKLKLDYV